MAIRPKQQLTPLDVPAIEIILKTICEHFNVTREALLSKSRVQPLPEARKLAAWTMVNLANISKKNAGQALSVAENTISSYVTRITGEMRVDKNFRRSCLTISDLVMAKIRYQLSEEFLIKHMNQLSVRVNTVERFVSVPYFQRDEIMNNPWFVYLTAKYKYHIQLNLESAPQSTAV